MRSKFTQLCFMLCLLLSSTAIRAQITGYHIETFEAATFPPTGWTVNNITGPTYTWVRSTAQAFNSTASAFIRYDAVAGGGEDWLITPQYSVTAATDSVIFHMRLAFQGFAPDSLVIRVSTTTNATASFTTRILRLAEGTNYPPNATSWVRYGAPLGAFTGQNIYIAFSHYNVNGDGLYVDNVRLGTQPPNEVSPVSINSPANGVVGPQSFTATVSNNGTATQTFNTTMQITPGTYTSTQTVTSLAPGATLVLPAFAPWTPTTPGVYTIKTFTELAGDANPTNDTITRTITIVPTFPNFGWSSGTPLPGGRWAGGQAFLQPCVAGTDTAYMYYMAGADASFSNTATCYRQNLTTGAWTAIAPIPQTRTQLSAAGVQGKIYLPGGYGGSFAPVTTLSIYDPATDSWTTGAPLPQAVGDYGIATYADSLIYVATGYSGSVDVTTVQVYNVNTNTWANATPFGGIAVGGGRMGISGNTLVFAGGYSQTLAATQQHAWQGVIDPLNPYNITWTALPNFPAGTSGRLAGGNSILDDGRVYFAAGDPNGAGTATITSVYAYNVDSARWEIGPSKPTGVSNISNFVSIIENDSVYMVISGGYNGSAVISNNERINLGPYTGKPYASNDIINCGADSILLEAFNGATYLWSPSGAFADPTLPTQSVFTNGTDTFYVTITPERFGCPVQDTVIVTVSPKPALTFTATEPLCNGDNNGSIEVNAPGSSLDYTYLWNTLVIDSIMTGVPAGTYTVTVTDIVTGCDSTASYVLSEPSVLSANVADVTATGCNGSLTATVSGGVSSYSYAWSPGGQTTATATNLCAGTYTVAVTDNNGCIVLSSGTVTDLTGIENTADALQLSVFPNPFADQFVVQGSLNTDATLTFGLFTMDGKCVYTSVKTVAAGGMSISIDAAPLAKGMYHLMVSSGNVTLTTFKVVKM